MNILHLNPELNIACGVSRVIFQITSHKHPELNHSVLCFGGDGINKFSEKNLNVQVLKRKNIIQSYLYHIFKIIMFCKKNNIEVIHSHHRYFDFLTYFISKFISVRTIMTVHSKAYDKKFLSYFSDKFIAVSETINKHLQINFGIDKKKIIVINNYVTNENIAFTNKEILLRQLNIKKGNLIVTYIGRFDKEKGVDILLKSIAKMKIKNVHFLFVGSGEEREFINSQVKRNNLPVTIVNSSRRIADYYMLSDIIILPSRVDSFPLVMVECGYFKKAFIGSEVDGIKEFIRNGIDGILFELEDFEGLTKSIIYLYENEKIRTKLSENLNKKVMSHYLFKDNFDKYLKLYQYP